MAGYGRRRYYRRNGFKRRRIGRRRYGGRKRYFRGFKRTLRRFAIGSPERKFDGTVLTGSIPQVATGITPQLLTGITEGTDNNQRVGRRVMLTNLQIRFSTFGSARLNSAVQTQNAEIVRILLVMDREYDAAGGAVPTLDDVLDLSTPGIYAYNDLQIQGTKRFRTLWDKIFVQYHQGLIPNTEVTDAYPAAKQHKYNKKMRTTLYFNGQGDTVGDAGKNAIWLFIFKQFAPNGTDYPVTIDGFTRIRFTDI